MTVNSVDGETPGSATWRSGSPLDDGGLLRRSVEMLTRQLPSYWDLTIYANVEGPSGLEVDALMSMAVDGGPRVDFVVEVKEVVRDVEGLLLRLDRLRYMTGNPVLLVTSYMNAVLRTGCADRGLSYLDATGWMRLESRTPPMFVSGSGAPRPPKSDRATDIQNLSGPGSMRIVRALLAAPTPIGVRELAGLAAVSPGSVAKVLPTLLTAGCVERDERGAVKLIRRRMLLERWVQDYSFVRTNRDVTWWLAPRGIEPTLSRAGDLEGLAVTGSLVSRAWLPTDTFAVAPLTLAALDAANPLDVASDLRLIPTPPSQANFVLARPKDTSVLQEARSRRMVLPEVPLAQALADLLTLPGRSVEEAEQVMDVLSLREPTWSREDVVL